MSADHLPVSADHLPTGFEPLPMSADHLPIGFELLPMTFAVLPINCDAGVKYKRAGCAHPALLLAVMLNLA